MPTDGDKPPKGRAQSREERLEAELRANLKRRKEQSRARPRGDAAETKGPERRARDEE